MTDNLTWSDDGHLLLAGVSDTTLEEFTTAYYGPDPLCPLPTSVVKVNPDTLECTIIATYDGGTFGAGTTALQVDDEVWVGSMRYAGVARFNA
jgi:hypothetical protein